MAHRLDHAIKFITLFIGRINQNETAPLLRWKQRVQRFIGVTFE